MKWADGKHPPPKRLDGEDQRGRKGRGITVWRSRKTANTKLQALLNSRSTPPQFLWLGDQGQAPEIPRTVIFYPNEATKNV